MSNSNKEENFLPINHNIEPSMTKNEVNALMKQAQNLSKRVNEQNAEARKLINMIHSMQSIQLQKNPNSNGGNHKKHTRKHKQVRKRKHTRKH